MLAFQYRPSRNGAVAPLVLLLHPISMLQAFWEPVAERLAERYPVLVVDLRGHGRNPPARGPFSLGDLAADVAEVVAAFGDGPVLAVGCSLGGMVAQGLAISAPGRVAGLVLANTNHEMSAPGVETMRQRGRNAAAGLDRTVEADLGRWFTPAFRAARPDVVDQVRRWVLANDAATVAQGWEAIANLHYARFAAGITVPVLVTTGELDPASPPPIARATAAAFPRGRYFELASTGHFAPLEQPDAFAALVGDFAATL